MAKKKEIIEENIISSPLNQLISDRYGDYAKYIIQDRALPDARDGLKPVQRRILYAMYKDGNTSDKGFRKSAKTVGLVIGNYHPHGDSSVYEAMVRLSQSWKINHPLVEMHGNNGSIDDDPAAAMRYTEARLAQIAETMLVDIDKETVVFSPNFDDTENEPTVLPAKFPNLLVNGAKGIAAGYATNIPPHNLNEVIDGTIYRIKHPDSTLEDLMTIIKGPDFPTKGIVMGLEGIKDAFRSGQGKVVVRAKAEIVSNKSCQQIIVSEIPYEVIKVNIVKKIDEIRIDKAIDGILDVRDESDRNGLRIVVDVHKDGDASMILNYLYKNTDLQINYNYNMVAIVNNRPVLLGLLEAIDAYVSFYEEVVLARSKHEFRKRLDRCHILEGLIKAVSVMDEVIKIIRGSKDKADAKKRLIARFGFSEAQAEAIVVLRLYRLTNTDIYQLKEEYEELVKQMRQLKAIIDDHEVLANTLCNELSEIKAAYGHERYTLIKDEVAEINIDKMSMIANERVVTSLSKDGYIKRISLRSFNASEGLTGLKNEDELIGIGECDTYDTLLAFSASGQYVYLPIYQLNESKFKDIGQHISNYIKINNAEKFIGGVLVKNFDSCCYVITASANGMIKRTVLSQWVLQRNSRSSLAMNISEDDKMIAVKLAYKGDEVYLVTRDGYSLRYSIDDIPEVSTRAKGVIGIRLSGDDKLASMSIISKDCSEMVYFTSKGNSKRIKINELPITKRASKGVLIAKKNKTNPAQVALCVSGNLNDDLNIYANKEHIDLKIKDINLLDADSRFSTSAIATPFYRVNGLAQALIVDFPKEEKNVEYENLTLEV